jgi:hypothetical protein
VASAEEIAWAAGLFEGEGSITRFGRSGKFDLRVSLNMTDEDVVRRFDAIVDRGKVSMGRTRPVVAISRSGTGSLSAMQDTM